jgi:hypothetical protein
MGCLLLPRSHGSSEPNLFWLDQQARPFLIDSSCSLLRSDVVSCSHPLCIGSPRGTPRSEQLSWAPSSALDGPSSVSSLWSHTRPSTLLDGRLVGSFPSISFPFLVLRGDSSLSSPLLCLFRLHRRRLLLPRVDRHLHVRRLAPQEGVSWPLLNSFATLLDDPSV